MSYICKLNKKTKTLINDTKTSNCSTKIHNQTQLKQKYTQPKVVSKYKRFTPSPFLSREKQKEKLNQTMVTPMKNYNKEAKILTDNNYFKLISASRREQSWDKSINDLSLNDSKLNKSIVRNYIKNKISSNLGTPNISKSSFSYLNMNEIGYSRYIKNDSIRETRISEVRKQLPYCFTEKKAKKAKPIGLKSKILINSCIQPKASYQIAAKEKFLKKQSNPSKLITSSHQKNSNEKKKNNTSTSFDSLITKETTSKIKIVEVQSTQSEKNERITKKIKCMHDLSKTGLTGTEKKMNQDAYFIFKNFLSQTDYIFMGVW